MPRPFLYYQSLIGFGTLYIIDKCHNVLQEKQELTAATAKHFVNHSTALTQIVLPDPGIASLSFRGLQCLRVHVLNLSKASVKGRSEPFQTLGLLLRIPATRGIEVTR